jgi:hypothetical protein
VAGSPVVIDANLALKLVLPDPQREHASALVARLMSQGSELVAPALWAYETTSSLL